MKDFKVIEVKRSIFEDNNADADKLRDEFMRRRINARLQGYRSKAQYF